MPALQYASTVVDGDFQDFLSTPPSGAYEGRWNRSASKALVVGAALLGFCPSNAGGQAVRFVGAPASGWTFHDFSDALPLAAQADQVPIAPGEVLARVRSSLSLNVSELAAIVGVGRPTIYAWLTGDAHPRVANAERLTRLGALAHFWETLSDLPIGVRVRQPTTAGDTFVTLVAAERYAEAEDLLRAAAKLDDPGTTRRVETVREALRRTGLTARVGSRQDEIDRLTR